MKSKTGIIFFLVALLILAAPASAIDKPKVILTFDDGWTSIYYKAFPILQANNQQGTLFIVTNYTTSIDAGTDSEWYYMNLSQLQTFYSRGWDVSSHTFSHAHLTTINSRDLQNELNSSMLWLNNNEFNRSSMFLAYPYGEYNNNVINAAKISGYVAARTVSDNLSHPQFTLSSRNVYELPTLTVCGATQTTYCHSVTTPSYI